MSTKKWSIAKAKEWHEKTPWLRGCNYLPADCCNRIAFWQELDFEQHLATMDKELALMTSIGFNSIRMILEFVVWDQQHDGFMQRFERVLQTAAKHGIGLMVGFGNDCVMPKDDTEFRLPSVGPQHCDWGYHGGQKHKHRPLPPGVAGYNPFLDEPETAERVYAMIHEIMAKYAADPRIVVWDLFNEPGNANRGEITLPHLKQFFAEARKQETLQPVTTGVWGWAAKRTYAPTEAFSLENSDVISYHNYLPYQANIDQIIELRKYGVHVTNVSPGAVDTGLYSISPAMTKLGKGLGIIVSPETLARRGLRALFHGRAKTTVPTIFWRILCFLILLTPTCVLRLIRRLGWF